MTLCTQCKCIEKNNHQEVVAEEEVEVEAVCLMQYKGHKCYRNQN